MQRQKKTKVPPQIRGAGNVDLSLAPPLLPPRREEEQAVAVEVAKTAELVA